MTLDSLRRDLAFGFRSHGRAPIVTTVIVATLALGIAASSVSFTLVNGLFLSPPPIQSPARFVRVYHQSGNSGQYLPISYPEFDDTRALRSVFDAGALEEPIPFSLGIGGRDERVRVFGERVSDGYFSVLGVGAAMGRVFTATEEQAGDALVVLSDGLWKRQFGADPAVLNRDVLIDGQPFRIIGVAPQGFGGTILGFSSDLWIPFVSTPAGVAQRHDRGYRGLFVMARLAPGIEIAQARSALDILVRRLQREYPETNSGVRLVALTESEGRVFPTFRDDVIGASAIMVLIALLVTMVACANVAGVLLVRGDARRPEIGMRLALGASRGRIFSQLLTEAAMLSVAAGTIGMALAMQAAGLLSATRVTLARGAAVGLDVGFDGRVLALSIAMTMLTTIVFGLVPALNASRENLVTILRKASARGWSRSWASRIFLAGQIAVSIVLLAAGGLFVRSLQHGRDTDLGFDPSNVVTTAVDVRAHDRSDADRLQLWTTLIDEVRRLPDTQSASLTYRLPLELGVVTRSIGPSGFTPVAGQAWPVTEWSTVETGYFRTLRIPFIEGRDFTTRDVETAAPVVILNDVLARQFWPDTRAAGNYVVSPDGERLEVIGVVRRSKYLSIGELPKPYMYTPLHGGVRAMNVVARASGDRGAYLQAIAKIVRTLDPSASMYDVGTLSSRVDTALAPTSGAVSSLGVIGLMALGLTALGLFGAVAHTVGRRTYEIGVRRALGAQNGNIIWLVARETVRLVVIGLCLGLVGALATSRAIGSLLYDVGLADPIVFASAPVLMAVCVAAIWVPIRRALRLSAATALRHE